MVTIKKIFISGLIVVAVASTGLAIVGGLILLRENRKLASDDPCVFEPEIRAFEERDREVMPPVDALLFVGSSSIRFWPDLENRFSPHPVINRGFGGSKVADILFFADRIIFRYRPKAIVFFAGTNDISGRANDKSPDQVFDDFLKLAQLIRERLPQTRFLFLPATPTTSRWNVWPQVNMFNECVRNFCRDNPQFDYVDATAHFLNESGYPRRELLWYDGVHLNAAGYNVWTTLIQGELNRPGDSEQTFR